MAYANPYAARKEHLSAAEYNTQRGTRPSGPKKKKEIPTPKHMLPDGVFVETNATFDIDGVTYLPNEVFERKHSVYDAIVTGIGRTSATRDVFETAKNNCLQEVVDSVNRTINRYKRYPSFQQECYENLDQIRTALANPHVEHLKGVMVGCALRNEIQTAVMYWAVVMYSLSIKNVKLG